MVLGDRYLVTSIWVQGATQRNSDDVGAVQLNVSVCREMGSAVQEGPRRFPAAANDQLTGNASLAALVGVVSNTKSPY